ncbi:MAG: substrate-binding domain-containing protein [Verrucomicrobia bacterium]|nr:substrate-binding domain-containing protein [Verrucomicrobiota bacterium]
MMNQRIRRESIVTQVVDVLKQELPRLIHGKWLPGERVLSNQFQVSRTTIRAALAQLQRQKLIRACPQKGYKILAGRRHSNEKPSRLIGWFQGSSQAGLKPRSQSMIRDIERGLNNAGYELKTFTDIHLRGHNRHQQLSNLVAEHRAAFWMLTAASFKTQEWFMKHGIPSLVLGSCYAGIKLTNLDIDYWAVCRHAAILLWRLGHRRLCLLAPRTRFGGDLAGEEGFQAALVQLSRGTQPPLILYHNESALDIRRVLDDCLSRTPVPTAFLVSHPVHALTTISYLMRRGLRVPEDISLICRDDDEFMEHLIPSLAHYAVDLEVFARRCIRMLIQMATSGHLKPFSRRMMPRFVRGNTVAPPTVPS